MVIDVDTLRAAGREIEGWEGEPCSLEVDLRHGLAVVSLLQLAMKHPEFDSFGPVGARAVAVLNELSAWCSKEGGPAVAELIRCGMDFVD